MRKCSMCKIDKDRTDFYDGRRNWCKSCCLKYRNTTGKNKQLKKRYGIDIVEYNIMLEKQNFSCAICKTHISNLSVNLAVDHCHKSLKIRGLLCYNCNSGLGRFKDNIDLLAKAISYLTPFNDKEYTNHVFSDTPENG